MGPVSLATMGPASRERRPRGVPRLPRDLLERRALLDRLHAAVGNGLIVLQAPAGFGKTTLAAAFVRELERDFDACWLSVDATCSTQEAFAERLAHAVLGPDAWAPVSISLGEDYRSYLAGILARWYETCTAAPLLVLDSLDQLEREAPAWALVEWVAEFTRERGEVLLLSREPLARRGFDRRIASGEASVFGASDLAFTLAEVEALCAAAGTDVDAAELFEATGGWPIAVMAVLRGAVPLDRTRAQGGPSQRSWERYLAAEVWRSVPEPLRPTLLRLSVLPECDESVGAELVGRDRWERALAWARESGFLVESSDGAMRLAPLFRQLLLRELAETPLAAQEAAEAAVRAFVASGNAVSALAIATELRMLDTVKGLLRSAAHELIDRGAFTVLAQAFEVLGEQEVSSDSLLRALRARAWSLAGRPRQALAEARAIAEQTDAAAEARFHALLAGARAARLVGRSEEALRFLDEAERHLSGGRSGLRNEVRLSAELAWYRGHTLLALGSSPIAEEELRRCVALCEARPDLSPLGLLARSSLGQAALMAGQVPKAIQELRACVQEWNELGGHGNLAWVLNNLCMAYLAVGDPASAIAAAGKAREIAQRAGNLRALAYASASLGDALFTQGDFENAARAYRDSLRLCDEGVTDDSLAAMTLGGLAAVAAARGEAMEADLFAKQANLVADALGSPYEIAACRLFAAAAATAAGEHGRAANLAKEAIELARRAGADGLLRQAMLHYAMACFRSRRRTEAERVLRELSGLLSEPWQVTGLTSVVRSDPLFAQWAAARDDVSPLLRSKLSDAAFALHSASTSRILSYPTVRVESLGTIRVYRDNTPVPVESFASAKAVEFLLLFLAHRGGLSKEEAVAFLYPDISGDKCNSAFHSNLYLVRRALYRDCIVKDGGRYVLNPDAHFEWDVDEFRRLLEDARAAPPGSQRRAELFRAAVALYRGPFAEIVQTEWAAALRVQLERRLVEALATLAGFHAGRGEFEQAADFLEQILSIDPLNDEAVYHLARFKALGGSAMAALALIDQFAEGLRAELGEDPPERLLRLRTAIATGAAV